MAEEKLTLAGTGTCRICGLETEGLLFNDWVRKTFTNFDQLVEGTIICHDCLFWFDESSAELAAKMGKDKPQRMRNYSHFVVGGQWTPLSKGQKRDMQRLLLSKPFPELAVVADSGQKHIAFRAMRNPSDTTAGFVQFEEQQIFVQPSELRQLLSMVEILYATFSKKEIKTGDYKQYRIRKFGLEAWYKLESQIGPMRDNLLFKLVLFLAQKEKGDTDDATSRTGSRLAGDSLAGDTGGLQKQIPNDDLETIRGQHSERGVHGQSRKIHQLALL